MTKPSSITAEELLQSLAIGQATGASSYQQMCKVSHLPAGSWQVSVIREASFVTTVTTPDELRAAIGKPGLTFILIPADAMISKQTLENACSESVLSKTIICEGEL